MWRGFITGYRKSDPQPTHSTEHIQQNTATTWWRSDIDDIIWQLMSLQSVRVFIQRTAPPLLSLFFLFLKKDSSECFQTPPRLQQRDDVIKRIFFLGQSLMAQEWWVEKEKDWGSHNINWPVWGKTDMMMCWVYRFPEQGLWVIPFGVAFCDRRETCQKNAFVETHSKCPFAGLNWQFWPYK